MHPQLWNLQEIPTGKSWKAKVRAEKASKFKSKMNKSQHDFAASKK